MGANSSIEWTTHTLNPWIGCSKVSDGCKHCYAEALDRRWRPTEVRWGPKAARTRTSVANWRKPIQWDAAAKAAGQRHRVFCASLADVFDDHPSIEPGWRRDLFALIDQTPNLDWLLLTKRPENVARMVPFAGGWPRNIWLGATVENQEQAEIRIPELLMVPAAVRWTSCEPLLGPVDLISVGAFVNGIDWVIVGGESGPGARPFDLEWARSLLYQCSAAGVACFVKQLGARPYSETFLDLVGRARRQEGNRYWHATADKKGGDWSEWPVDLRVREFPRVLP